MSDYGTDWENNDIDMKIVHWRIIHRNILGSMEMYLISLSILSVK